MAKWQTGSYSKVTVGNWHMLNWEMMNQHHILIKHFAMLKSIGMVCNMSKTL